MEPLVPSEDTVTAGWPAGSQDSWYIHSLAFDISIHIHVYVEAKGQP